MRFTYNQSSLQNCTLKIDPCVVQHRDVKLYHNNNNNNNNNIKRVAGTYRAWVCAPQPEFERGAAGGWAVCQPGQVDEEGVEPRVRHVAWWRETLCSSANEISGSINQLRHKPPRSSGVWKMFYTTWVCGSQPRLCPTHISSDIIDIHFIYYYYYYYYYCTFPE